MSSVSGRDWAPVFFGAAFFFGAVFCLGIVFLVLVAIVFGVSLIKDFRTSVSFESRPWADFAQTNNLQFRQLLGNVNAYDVSLTDYH